MTLTFMSAQKWSLVISARDGTGALPSGRAAQLTSMSIRPNSAAARSTMAFTDSSSPVSAAIGTIRRPVSAPSSDAASSSASRPRAAIATSTPSEASSRRDCLADPAAAARNYRRLSCQLEVHVSPPPRGEASSARLLAEVYHGPERGGYLFGVDAGGASSLPVEGR